jgi:hypothetical protein
MHVVVREQMQPLDVAEVIHVQNRVVGVGRGAAPRRVPDAAVAGGRGEDGLVAAQSARRFGPRPLE